MARRSMMKQSALPVALVPAPVVPLRLDLGCGVRKKEGFVGVDIRQFPGVDKLINLAERMGLRYAMPSDQPGVDTFRQWPWADGSVEEIYTSHFVEHLDAAERVHFVNEAHRVLKPGGKMTLICPNWSSCRAYGDMTHKWPPVSEQWFYYVKAAWRASEAPHNDFYSCDFDVTWAFIIREEFLTKNQEQQMFAMQNYKDVCQDVIATFAKAAPPPAG